MADVWDQFPDAQPKADPWAAFPDANGSKAAPVQTPYQQGAPSGLARFGRGMLDLGQGISQRILQGEDALHSMLGGPAPEFLYNPKTKKYERVNRPIDPTSAEYTAKVNDELALYNKGREGQGFDWTRAAGAGAASLPLAMIGGNPTSVAGRALSGGAQGGLSGFLQFDPTNSLKGVGTNTGMGFGIGAIASPVIGYLGDKAGEGLSYLIGKYKGLKSAAAPMTEADLIQAIPHAGDLPTAARGDLLADAQRMIQDTGQYDPEQLIRKANLLAQGVTPTKSMITRNPADWTLERNLQKLSQSPDEQLAQVGTKLTDVYQGNDKALAERLASFRNGLPSGTQEAHGQTIINSLDKLSTASQKEVGKVYDQVRQTYGDDLVNNAHQLMSTLNDLRDNAYASKLVDSVTNRLKRLGMVGSDGELTNKTLTVSASEELRKFVNTLPNDYGRSSLIRAIDADVLSGTGEVAGARTDAMSIAREAAQKRFQMLGNASTQKAVNAAGELTEGKTAQNFVQSQIISGSEQDVQKLVSTLGKAPDNGAGLNAARSGVLQWIENKAVNPNSGQVSGAALNNAMRQIGEGKLISVLGQDKVTQLQNLARASLDATYQPAYSAVNSSNTAPMLMSLTQRSRMFPFVPLAVTDEMQKATARLGYAAQLRQALAAQPQATLPQIPAGLLGKIREAGGLFPPFLGGAFADIENKTQRSGK